jgi:adenosine deaminase
MYEKNAHALLKEMAEKHVMVEINLTSNDVILGITGKQHPVTAYLAADVPIALSTDDEGVSRIDLTHEYVRAVEEFGLGYLDLKRSARTSIEHSFLPGTDLWAVEDSFTTVNAACAIPLSGECRVFLTKSEKAQQQWNLEQRFTIFETNLGQANGR